MAYNDSYGGGGGAGGGGGGGYSENPEYGGGGRGSDNYYNQGGGGGSGGGSYNNESQERREGYGHNSNYGGGGGGGGGGGEYSSGGGQYSGGGGGNESEFSSAYSHAQQHGTSSSDENSIFSSALGFLGGNKHKLANEDIDERQAIGAHQAVYGDGSGGGQHDSQTLGTGAAMQALKLFTGGGGGGSQGGQGGQGGQNKLIGMAMGQASKLFDQQSSQGNVAPSASKQNAVNEAGKMALKFYLKSQGGGGGGLGSIASKFF